MELHGGEAWEPLGGGYYILQSKTGYRFGSDAIALAKFAARRVKQSDRVFDLCSGCGIVGIQLHLLCGCAIDGAELDGELFSMSVRTVEYNGLKNVRFCNADVRDIAVGCGDFKNGYDAVVCNPPFFKADSRSRKVAASANSELTVTLGDAVNASARLLRQSGEFYAVYTSSRLDEAICACRAANLMPKELVLRSGGKTFLLRCVKGGRQGMTVCSSSEGM